MVIRVNGKYDSEDEALIGLLCLCAAEKYDHRVAVITSQCMLTRYDKKKVTSSFVSNFDRLMLEYDVLFDFSNKLPHNKQLIIRDHTLGDYHELESFDLKVGDVVLIKNYVPAYKSEKSLFGPNMLKSKFNNKVKVFAVELDLRIQNSIYLGVMENGYYLYNSTSNNSFRKILFSIFKVLTKEGV